MSVRSGLLLESGDISGARERGGHVTRDHHKRFVCSQVHTRFWTDVFKRTPDSDSDELLDHDYISPNWSIY